MSAHRTSYRTFKGKIPKGKEIRHTCHRPLCINPDHLILGTRTQNMLDRLLAGRKGNKITPMEVMKIRHAHGTQEEIGKRFGINQSMVSKIKRRQCWTNVR